MWQFSQLIASLSNYVKSSSGIPRPCVGSVVVSSVANIEIGSTRAGGSIAAISGVAIEIGLVGVETLNVVGTKIEQL